MLRPDRDVHASSSSTTILALAQPARRRRVVPGADGAAAARTTARRTNARYFEWLAPRRAASRRDPDARCPRTQAADNLSVSNAITLAAHRSATPTGPTIVAATSVADAADARARRRSPPNATTRATRRCTRSSGSRASSGRSEREVATTLLGLMHGAESSPESGDVDARTVANYWLRGAGRGELRRALGLADDRSLARHRRLQRAALPAYLGAIGVADRGAGGLDAGAAQPGVRAGDMPTPWLAALAALLMLFPASEAVVAIVNRLISESTRPVAPAAPGAGRRHPARAPRRWSSIPAMLTSARSAAASSRTGFELHYLANPERARAVRAADRLAPTRARQHRRRRRRRCSTRARRRDRAPQRALSRERRRSRARFLLLHRERRFATTEQRWIGWERKRGKLEQLIALLAERRREPVPRSRPRCRPSPPTPATSLTLDSDTEPAAGPPARAGRRRRASAQPAAARRADGERVVARLRHPAAARRDAAARRRDERHALPLAVRRPVRASTRTAPRAPRSTRTCSAKAPSPARACCTCSAMHAVLGGRLPEDRVLSHDLLEGSIARCAAVTDITVIEDAPFHADVAASRVHRWTRGDWQLLPFLLHAGAGDLRAINRWKMFDNLRRSLVAPTVAGACCCWRSPPASSSPWAALVLVARRSRGGPLMGALAGLVPSRDDIALPHFYRQALRRPGARAGERGLARSRSCSQLALMAADAIVRALYRMAVSRRHLLQWTTAAAAQAAAHDRPRRRRCGGTGRAPGRAGAARLLLLAARHAVPRGWPSLLCVVWAAVAAVDLVGQPAAAGRAATRSRRRRPRLPPRRRARHLAPVRALRRRRRQPPAARQPADRAARHGRAPHLADQHRPVPAGRRPARASSAGSARSEMVARARGDARHAGHAAAPPRPLPELVRHADRRSRCCRCTCPRSTAATSAATCSRVAQACLDAGRDAADDHGALRRAHRRCRRTRIARCAPRREPLERRSAARARCSATCPIRVARRCRRASTAAARAKRPTSSLRAAGRAPPRRGRCRRRRDRLALVPVADHLATLALGAAATCARAAARRRARAPCCAHSPHALRAARRGSPTSASCTTASATCSTSAIASPSSSSTRGFYDLLASESRLTSLLADRQGRRAGQPLGRARPAVLRRRRARRPALVVGLDVRVPDADAGARRAARQRAAQRRATPPSPSRSPSRARTTCRGASPSRPMPAATTRSPTSTRRRACRGWRCAARRPTSWWSRRTRPRWRRRSRRTAPSPTCAARSAARARGRYGFIEALDFTPARQAGAEGVTPASAPSWRTTRA